VVDFAERRLAVPADAKKRCPWPGEDRLSVIYHDEEWGVPVHDETKLFEFLVLDAAQAGLSWRTILHKRENYREAFDGFDPETIARYDKRRVERLMKNEGIVRNRLKIESAIANARALLELKREMGSFDRHLWSFVGGTTKVNAWRSLGEIPAQTSESLAMSKDLSRRGFRFVGPTICYAFMQAAGLVNDHLIDCFRYRALAGHPPTPRSPRRHR
jgi:DNA-3-methyladenine glycosylase I